MTGVIRLPVAARGDNRSGLWPTVTARGLADIIEASRLTGQLALIAGPSGVGKTTAVRGALDAAEAATADDLDRPALVSVSMTRASEGLQPGLLRIAATARIPVANHLGAHDVHEALVRHDWPQGSLIVLDEAQFMSDALLHGVRNVWDELDQDRRPVGIVLIGTLDLAQRINGRSAKNRAFEPLRGRLGAYLELGALEPEDCSAICRHLGITEKNAEALIRRAAAQSGGLHNVRRLLSQVERIGTKGKGIAFADLKHAAALAGVAS